MLEEPPDVLVAVALASTPSIESPTAVTGGSTVVMADEEVMVTLSGVY
jgi:hypothetical protein